MTHKVHNMDAEFIGELKKFARRGYRFDSEHELRKGTDQDPSAKGTQREAFDGFVKGLEANHRHGYFEIPTGVGKTALFISLIKNYLAAMNGDENAPRVLIAVPSNDLVIQTAKAIAKFMPDIAKTIETDDDQGKEIDWENSDIGVQYSKKKHAHLKPKVLITTYQSLAKDEDKKPKARVYPPDEYGFVVFDEGHNVTAAKFGRAVDRFKDSIQLAVTATPEYSEEKTVPKKLPHCHFSISLAEAINRGDLCPVDPVLIKTNYHVDEKKLRKFLQDQRGKDLTQGQMEKLLNQEARNLAAIKTYLLGTDENTGERYFGKKVLAFAGGIQHCEDFTRQMENVLKTPKYKKMRDWLKAEGIAPIAYLHSKFPKEGVDLVIDGKRRKCSKEELKQLHREGKILILVSDKELREGSDFPADSIVLELVDRLSVVDTTQRFGRGFRLDPDDQDKRCTAFNLVDENTYDLYKDTPHMLPIYAAEILEGAEFRRPARRKHLLQRFKNDIPDAPETLQEAGFDVITNIERVRAVSERYKKRKAELDYPGKTDEWLSLGTELPKELHITPKDQKFRSWRKNLEEKVNSERMSEVPFKVQKRLIGSRTPICVHRDDLSIVRSELGITDKVEHLPVKKKGIHLALSRELPNHLGTISQNKRYDLWRRDIERKVRSGQKILFGKFLVEEMNSNGKIRICVHKGAVPIIADELEFEMESLPNKESCDLGLDYELPRKLGIAPKNPKYLEWLACIKHDISDKKSPKIGQHAIIKMKGRGSTPLCLHEDAVPILAEQLGFSMNGKKHAEARVPRKSIHPDSPHIQNRTGRSRAITSDGE